MKVEVEGSAEEVMLNVIYEGEKIAEDVVPVDRDGIAIATFTTQSPKLWYPHSYGLQPLYFLTATLLRERAPLDVCTKRLGLRKVEVIQRKLKDADGTSFYFEVNNIPIFCGGSNWIPADSFIPRISPQRYHDWVRKAVEGNQIMLRVWGGGIYEEPAFYDACDELGVLVWQDFMFACGNYPANPEFLELVKREADANIKLLRHHPSIVLFAGNNEDYQYCETERLDYDPHDHDPESWLCSTFPARYIYEKILAEVTALLVPNTYYHFGSPYGGKTTADPTVGDIHQWNVWHGTQEPYQEFPSLSGRFVTEFGMQGLPSIETINNFLSSDDPDRYALSSTIDFHNKASGHVRRVAMYMNENVRYDFEPLETYIYYTQIMQAECVGTAYRSFKRNWKGPEKKECAGALVWQMNDCWPGTSWAIMDYYLNPKLAYYAIKRELQSLTIGLQRSTKPATGTKYINGSVENTHSLEVWAVNLSLETYDVYVTIHSFDLVSNIRTTITTGLLDTVQLLPNRSTEVTTFDIPGSKAHRDEANQPVIAAYLHDRSGKQLARAVDWPEPLKWVHMPRPGRIEVKFVDSGGLDVKGTSQPNAISLLADVCIKGLRLGYKGDERVAFEDNGIDLVPGEEVTVGANGMRFGYETSIVVDYMGKEQH